ncbi:cystathionine beta-lyase [Terricaulis sp.]|uniref:cystathionine beta-lyase n=1 Tax=Terricaulis sp. TaxID=2768686 RepID=UPI0037837BCB
MKSGKVDPATLHPETRLAHAGRDPALYDGAVNPPVHRATTLVIDEVAALYGTPRQTYALDGMAVHAALEAALLAVEGGAGATLAPSGLAAVTLALLAVVKSGDDILVTDSVYKPTRRFCEHFLARMGVTARFYDPRIGAGIADLITANTTAVFMESPGSLTFEIQDVPAIAAAAHTRGVTTILDNTWSAGLYLKPFALGVDISVQALSKYQGGHNDAFMGAVLSASPAMAARVRRAYKDLGLFASPDDSYLVLRGMRSLAVRMERQSASALQLALWLQQRPEVAAVHYPALANSPDHALWTRDFSGASGAFAFTLKAAADERVTAMLESLALFAMGFSWGGYESLIVPVDKGMVRTAAPWAEEGPTIRVSIGLEHPDDLIADLARAFAALKE